MTKTLTLGEAKLFIDWFIEFKNEKIKSLPLKVQWKLFSNAKLIEPDVVRFVEFRKNAIIDLEKEYFSEEKSEEEEIELIDEFTKEPIMEKGRRVKVEYFEEYQARIDELNKTISELLSETNTYEISELDIDKIVDELPNDTNIELVDIEFMSLFE